MSQSSTAETMQREARRLRSLADRLEQVALELLDLMPQRAIDAPKPSLPKFAAGEFAGMTQHAAILKALELYGPQTTRQLFDRLNAGGMTFKKPVYVTAILGRLKDVTERTPENKLKLKEKKEGSQGGPALIGNLIYGSK